MIDVTVPVCKGVRETRRCIDSVLEKAALAFARTADLERFRSHRMWKFYEHRMRRF